MHHFRLCAVLIDCKTSDVGEAARFWAEALGRPVDLSHPGSRENYRMLETPPDEPIVQIQRVEHESRVHPDIESDDIPAEVARLEKLAPRSWISWSAGWSCRHPPANDSAWFGNSVPASRRTPIVGTKIDAQRCEVSAGFQQHGKPHGSSAWVEKSRSSTSQRTKTCDLPVDCR